MTGRRFFTLDEAIHLDTSRNLELHRRHLNPRLATLCELIGAATPLREASGAYVWDAAGNRFLDFVSGYAALNLGHNHPALLRAMERVKDLTNLVEGPSTLAAALAHNLSVLAPGALPRVLFANSGAEVVDAAVKLARAATGRERLVACEGSFHGRTLGALSVTGRRELRENFGSLIPGVSFVPFGDAEALQASLRAADVAGFIVEPLQGEGGMVVPPSGYLRDVRDICSRHGTLMIADEIQTGLGRTGKMFALDHEDVASDVLLLGKGLGGGVMPLSAILTTEQHWRAARGGTPRSPFQFPTFGGCTLSCAAGLATLEVLQAERLVERAASLGSYLLRRLQELGRRSPLIQGVRGRGLMIGIEFAPATRGLKTALTAGVLNRLSHRYLSGIVLMELRSRHGIMTLNTLHDPNVLRAQPPLTIGEQHCDTFVDALRSVLDRLGSFPKVAIRSWHLLARAHGA